MKLQDSLLLIFLGFAIWVLGTVYYAYVGRSILETTPAHYWISFITSPIISAVICIAISCGAAFQLPSGPWLCFFWLFPG